MFGICSSHGCDKPSYGLSSRCRLHSVMEDARNLSPENFDSLRETLAVTAPITEDERNRRRGASALRRVEWLAKDLRAAKRSARRAGVTKGQIADAVERGKKAGA